MFERDCTAGSLTRPTTNCAPALLPSTGDLYEDCVTRINQLRWECQCLPPLERWADAEPCTDDNARFDSENGPHASFGLGQCGATGAVAQNECPHYPSTEAVLSGCFQSMWDEGPGGGHYENMSSHDYSRVACGFYFEPDGRVYATHNLD